MQKRRPAQTRLVLTLIGGAALLPGGAAFQGCTVRHTQEPPPISAEAIRCFVEGRRLLRDERDADAKAKLLKAIELAPGFVEAHRLYQEATIALCEVRPLIEQYDQWLKAAPNDPVLLYLNGRLRTDPEEQKKLFEKALAQDPRFAWGYFGLARVAMRRQDTRKAESLYRKAISLWKNENPSGFIALGAALLRQGRNADALKALVQATTLDPEDGGAWLLQARALARLNEHSDAIASALTAVRREPGNKEAHDLLRLLLTRHGGDSDFDSVARACLTLLFSHPDIVDLHLTLALAQHRGGDLAGAVHSYGKARSLGASPSDYANDLRLLYVRLRRYDQALGTWQEKALPDIALAPASQVRPRFERVVTATEEAQKVPNDPTALLALAQAYEGAGWLDEALVQYERVAVVGASYQPQALAARDRLQRHLEFCKRIRALFDENYFRSASGLRTLSTSAAIRQVHQLASEILPAPIEGKTKVVKYAFLGEVTDFHYPPASGLQGYFWQYDQLFVIGRPFGQPVQCLLVNVISWETDRRAVLWDRLLVHDRLVVENAGVRSSDEVLSDVHIGGQAVDRTYYVDIDRAWEVAAAQMEMVRKLGGLIRTASQEPPQPTDPLKVRYLSCVPEILRWQGMMGISSSWTAGDRYLRQRLFSEVLAAIDAHEMGHVLDALSYIPVGSHLLADAALLVQNGFSSRAVMAMTERNAQLAALAHVPEPRFALAGALAYAARDTELTEHARGYLDFVEKWVRYIGDNPQQYPQMDARARLLDQFPRLQPEQIHELALTVAREYGLPQRARKILKDTRP